MQTPDLSLENKQIKAYFEGGDKYLPASELLYIHTHPLVKPNFLADIEQMVNLTAEFMMRREMSGKPVERFTILAKRLGKLLPELSRGNAAEALDVLREVYRLCKKITASR